MSLVPAEDARVDDWGGGELLPLTLLSAGESGRVAEVLGGCELTHRLREMGLNRGMPVRMERVGNPCIVRVGDRKLCLRGADLSGVLVCPCGGA